MDKLDIVGLALYWGEGTKVLSAGKVEFVTSDPEMAKVFIKFLRKQGVEEKRLRAKVQSIRITTEKRARKYWSQIIDVPLSQFVKSRIKPGFSEYDYMGCITIMYSSTALQKEFLERIKTLYISEN